MIVWQLTNWQSRKKCLEQAKLLTLARIVRRRYSVGYSVYCLVVECDDIPPEFAIAVEKEELV
jgi:hypothetical protein